MQHLQVAEVFQVTIVQHHRIGRQRVLGGFPPSEEVQPVIQRRQRPVGLLQRQRAHGDVVERAFRAFGRRFDHQHAALGHRRD